LQRKVNVFDEGDVGADRTARRAINVAGSRPGIRGAAGAGSAAFVIRCRA
jgi:hypothetical protein